MLLLQEETEADTQSSSISLPISVSESQCSLESTYAFEELEEEALCAMLRSAACSSSPSSSSASESESSEALREETNEGSHNAGDHDDDIDATDVQFWSSGKIEKKEIGGGDANVQACPLQQASVVKLNQNQFVEHWAARRGWSANCTFTPRRSFERIRYVRIPPPLLLFEPAEFQRVVRLPCPLHHNNAFHAL